jgi:alkanesulfonate monooxygenase SsuD/methylene tetrahydromethanopterin reductase-like flavin-dependent oxidoreductase (luciferase family)
MKIGMALPYNQTVNMVQWAQLAEQHGWDGLFLGDAIWCEDPMIALAAAAVVTTRIRLGITVIPTPLRRPWKLASEAVALDHLSAGRLILGLGTGAVWMGWQGFPDEATDDKIRREILDETIDILTLLFQRKPFDYEGNQYHVKLSLLNEMYYPPKAVQQPRIPLWTPVIWPSGKSMQRAYKCDGVILEKRSRAGRPEEVTPEDVYQAQEYIVANRPGNTPYDIVVIEKSLDLDPAQRWEKLNQYKDAGATWWIEGLWEETPETVFECIQQGPPIKNA